MITTCNEAVRTFMNLDDSKFLIAEDDAGNQFVIESVCKRKLHTDDEYNWCYALKIKNTDCGCIIR